MNYTDNIFLTIFSLKYSCQWRRNNWIKVNIITSCSNPYSFVIGETSLKCGNRKHCGRAIMVKGHTKVTPWHGTLTSPNQCHSQVSCSYTLHFVRYSLDKAWCRFLNNLMFTFWPKRHLYYPKQIPQKDRQRLWEKMGPCIHNAIIFFPN